MAAYTPDFQHDLFVSYGCVDDQLGWVSGLVVLSPGYLMSNWCQQELLKWMGVRGASRSRIFVIESEYLGLQALPGQTLKRLLG